MEKVIEKFYLENPSMERKNDVIEYMNEHVKYNSAINGTGSFDHVLEGETYEECMDRYYKIQDNEYAKSIDRCPGKTYFLIRKNDNKLIGMINIRHHLTPKMLVHGGHIGYGIRPTERRKGYNKINLYLGLLKALEEFNLDKVMLDCDVKNLGSDKTIQALGGVLERTDIDDYDGVLTNVYWINTKDSIRKYKDVYQKYMY
ncbi:putative superoxide reductase [Clostridium sp. CAG:524]|nr:putative superoxide reductase [Clostridium sp. CAG:524]